MTELGISTDSRPQCSKTPSSIVVTEFGIDTDFMPVHPIKANLPIFLTELGMVTEDRPEQLSKAEDPILVTELGMSIKVKPLQPRKAYSPMLVTEFGIETDVIFTLYAKAPPTIVVILSGME